MRDGTRKLEARDGTGHETSRHGTGRDSQEKMTRDGTGRDEFLVVPRSSGSIYIRVSIYNKNKA